jgi:2,4-dichlorophenol 6-monooxygenase
MTGCSSARRAVVRTPTAKNLAIVAALGIAPDLPPEQCQANVLELWQDGPAGEARRAAVRRAVASQSMEFKEHNVEFGFRARSSAVVDDDSPEPSTVDDVCIYVPSTSPGSPLPHAYVQHEDTTLPLRAMAPPDSFLLVAGEADQAWCDATTKAVAERGLKLTAIRVGHVDGDWLDPGLAFVRVREYGPEGAILVRPDRVVA